MSVYREQARQPMTEMTRDILLLEIAAAVGALLGTSPYAKNDTVARIAEATAEIARRDNERSARVLALLAPEDRQRAEAMLAATETT